MSTSKHIDKICLFGLILAVTIVLLGYNSEVLGIEIKSTAQDYATRLFDTSTVHQLDIIMEDWQDFLQTCTDKEYTACNVVIDGETFNNVAIRAKGNNSLSSVSAYDNDRYSFKIEFDHYDNANTYHGLDKISLTNLIQDNTMMKDYLVYQLMRSFGVNAPLCSYVYITVNGEDWGLYLAVESIEESFLQRNYGSDYGELYKPDNMNNSNGAGPGPSGDNQDVKLLYIDNNSSSYANIFDNAKTAVTEADKQRLISSIRRLNENDNLAEVLNMESVIRYFVVHNFVCNFDSYTGQVIHNYYLYEKDGQLEMLPWDYNLAFGGFQANISATELVNYPIDSPVVDNDLASRPMIAWIFNNAEYTSLYHQYFADFINDNFNDSFDKGAFVELFENTYNLIAPYVYKDPTKFCSYTEFEQGAAALKEFCLLRAQSVSAQLQGVIPATSEEQKANNATLIDASAINLNDMGSMNGGNFAGPDMAGLDNKGPGMEQEPGNQQAMNNKPPDMPSEAQNRPPENPGENFENKQSGSEYLILLFTLLILALGIIGALKFKR